MSSKKFPKDFLWGVATSSHQIEGNNKNNWTKWEIGHAKKKTLEGFDPNNFRSGKACDSWNRYEEDHQIIKELGLNAYRFSIEWSRIEPQKGSFSMEAIEHYESMLDSLIAKGITPMVTLWHWTIPIWLDKEGGILSENLGDYFSRYVEFVIKHLGDKVQLWITVNEPLIFSGHGYLSGERPPNERNLIKFYRSVKNLIKVNNLSYQLIKKEFPDAKVGASKNRVLFEPYKGRIYNKLLSSTLSQLWNEYYIKKTLEYCDFIGLNFYTKAVVDITGHKKTSSVKSEIREQNQPLAIYHVLKELDKYNKPIYITENGLSDAKDKFRPIYIEETLKSLDFAISQGIDLRGYFYWSLLDNFEWDSGYAPKFGLVSIDRETCDRKIKDSAYTYAKLVNMYRTR